MYIKSPMEKFNSNNPFIIVCKKTYDNIVDTLQLFVKESIRLIIINLIIFIILAILYIYMFYLSRYMDIYLLLIFILCGTINIFTALCINHKIKYFLSLHPSIQEFCRISELEINDILVLNNEDVLRCSEGLHEVKGELNTTSKYYKRILIFFGIFEIFLIIIAILDMCSYKI